MKQKFEKVISKTLEEKKNELAQDYAYRNNISWATKEVEHDIKTYSEAFDAGIKAYKEILNESVEVKLDRDSIHDNVVEKWSEHWYDPKINEQDTANYRRRILSVDSNMRYSIARMMSEYVEPVLAKLQQQTEKIEGLEKENEKLKGAKLAYYMMPDRLRLGKTTGLITDMIQQMRPNSEIKVTCPDVEQLEQRVKELDVEVLKLKDENNECVDVFCEVWRYMEDGAFLTQETNFGENKYKLKEIGNRLKPN